MQQPQIPSPTASTAAETDLPEELRPELAVLLYEYARMGHVLSRRNCVLVWLERLVSELASEIRGDVTKKLATRTERHQCFITLEDGSRELLDEWVTKTVLDASESQDSVPEVSYRASGRFCLGLMVLHHDIHEKTVAVPRWVEKDGVVELITTHERLIEVGPVMRCAAAWARGFLKTGRRALTERPIPEKWTAFRDLAVHLGIISQNMEPATLRRTLLRARATRWRSLPRAEART